MTINTKFNVGDKVFLIMNDDIVSFPVFKIICYNTLIVYSFKSNPAKSNLDRDEFIERREFHVFASIDDLANFYKKQLK